MSITYNTSIARNGLLLHFDAANPKSYPGTGTTLTDLSGNDNNGTLVNGVGYSSDNQGSLTYDGVNDYITLSPSLLIKNLTTNFSFEGVVKFNTSGGQYGIFTKGNNFSSGWTVYLRQGPQFSFIGSNSSGTSSGLLATTIPGEISVGNWYHVVYTYNSANVICYVNGEFKNSSGYSQVFNDSGNSPIIGYEPSLAAPNFWNGNIPLVRLYNRALSAAEVQQNFEATRGRYGI